MHIDPITIRILVKSIWGNGWILAVSLTTLNLIAIVLTVFIRKNAD